MTIALIALTWALCSLGIFLMACRDIAKYEKYYAIDNPRGFFTEVVSVMTVMVIFAPALVLAFIIWGLMEALLYKSDERDMLLDIEERSTPFERYATYQHLK